jgi:hypothetical protein
VLCKLILGHNQSSVQNIFIFSLKRGWLHCGSFNFLLCSARYRYRCRFTTIRKLLDLLPVKDLRVRFDHLMEKGSVLLRSQGPNEFPSLPYCSRLVECRLYRNIISSQPTQHSRIEMAELFQFTRPSDSESGWIRPDI